MLGGVLIFGREINGAKAWYDLGFFRLQPAEFTKLATALILAKYVSITGVKLTDFRPQLLALLALALPIGLIQLQPDTGSLLVFAAFLIPLYREGFPAIYLILGITVATLFILTLLVDKIPLLIGVGSLGLIIILFQLKQRRKIPFTLLILVAVSSFIFATDYILNEVMYGYQKARIEAIFRPELVDPMNEGWNLEQSKIAIGSGGFTGKGFLEGTQTKFGYVQSKAPILFLAPLLKNTDGWEVLSSLSYS